MYNRFAFPGRASKPRSFPTRLLLWSLVVAAIFGVLGVGEPIENLLRVSRNMARNHTASGDIVVAGIDDATLNRLSAWPLPRRYDAQLIDRLFDLGARRVLLDIDLSSSSNSVDDLAFEQALERHGQKVVLAASFYIDSKLGERRDRLPITRFLRHSDIGDINVRYDRTNAILDLPYAFSLAGNTVPSLSSKLAGMTGKSGETYPIDFSIDPRSIPVVSMIDVLDGKVARQKVAGKDVVIGTWTDEVQDVYYAPGYGRIPGVDFHVLGAETLKAGRPFAAGWIFPYFAAAIIAFAALMRHRRTIAIILLSSAAIAIFAAPFVLEHNHIFVDIIPALLLLSVPACTLGWHEMRDRFRARATTNALSGLRNLNALRLETIELDRLLVVARVHNYAEVLSTLPADTEKTLINQIAARLTLGAPGLELYQGDDGVFAWLTEEEGDRLSEHLTALYSLFRSPVVVAGSNVDLVLTFGIDAGRDRSIANRFGSALVAASEAATEGCKWKQFDASKLKDAAWKLSLLGQLDAAIDGGDLWVAYQPKLDLAQNRIIGAEALVRWTHPEKGPISPMEFVVAAEQNNRIEKLTMHVLERAIATAAAINAHGISFSIAVNLSARLLDDHTLGLAIITLLKRHNLPASLLTLEITETAALNASHGFAILRDLRNKGIGVSIDDYGTGLSTLEYLKKIPANEIKIDKTFIQSMNESPSDLLMVNSTIQLAHSLGHTVVAEGVEQSTQLDRLIEMSCDTAQGYFIGRPMTFQALTRRLLSERKRAA